MRVQNRINDARTVLLRNGKRVKRVIHTNKDYWHYIIYNGYRIGVKPSCGEWYEE